MLKKILLSGLLLVFLMGCGWLNLPMPGNNPQPTFTAVIPAENPTAQPQPTETRRTPSRNTPTPDLQATSPVADLPVAAPEIAQVDEPLYVVQPGTPARVTNFLAPDAGCSYLGIAGQVFDIAGLPVEGLILEVSGELDGKQLLQLVLSGSSIKLGPGGYEIKLADRAMASQGTLTIQVFDLAGLALSEPIVFDTLEACDANQILLNFTATKIEYDEILYFPFVSNE